MSGKDERTTYQCPICNRVGDRTKRWSGFVGEGSTSNWCYLHLDEKTRVRTLDRKYLCSRHKLFEINRVKCRSCGVIQDARHTFYPGDATFERVKAAILCEDARMCQDVEARVTR